MPAWIRSPGRTSCVVALASFFLFVSFVHAANRPVPEVVNVKAFAKEETGRVELLIRVPLAAVKDVQFPTRGDGDTLDLPALKSMLPGAAKYWIAGAFDVFDRGERLAAPEVGDTVIAISSDQSFNSYESALAHFTSPDLPPQEQLFWQQVWFDIRLVYPLKPGEPHISVNPRVADLGVRVFTDLGSIPLNGDRREFSFEGNPGLVYLEPHSLDAVQQFIARGARFVVQSAEFLLLLFCVALPFRRYRHFLPAMVTFSGALTLALLLAMLTVASDTVWFRPLSESLAVVFIFLAACANIAGRVTPRRRALFTLGAGAAFGLLCASYLMGQLQFAGAHAVAAGVTFDAGVLAATGGVVALLIPVLSLLFSFARVEPLERIIVSALAADTSWGWLTDSWAQLRKIPVRPALDAGLLALVLRGLAVLVLIAGVVWFVNEWLKSQRFADEDVAPNRTPGTAS